jgi:hypothetical protein
VRYFKHNDMADLERLLQQIAAEDKRRKRSVLEQRRFIAVRFWRVAGSVEVCVCVCA